MMKNFKTVKHSKQIVTISIKEKSLLLGKSILIIILLDYIFYRSLWAVIPLSVIGVKFYTMERQTLLQKKKELIREQFKELLLLAATGQKAGNSVENAFISSYCDMEALFGKDSSICKILSILQQGRINNISFVKMWRHIGQETEVEEILNFADIYEIAYQSSGNMAAVMEKTARIIIQKAEVQKEIHIMLCAKQLEQKIMNIMPFVIMIYVNFTSPGYFNELYHTVFGVFVMSACMIFYLLAYIISVKIISVSY